MQVFLDIYLLHIFAILLAIATHRFILVIFARVKPFLFDWRIFLGKIFTSKIPLSQIVRLVLEEVRHVLRLLLSINFGLWKLFRQLNLF